MGIGSATTEKKRTARTGWSGPFSASICNFAYLHCQLLYPIIRKSNIAENDIVIVFVKQGTKLLENFNIPFFTIRVKRL